MSKEEFINILDAAIKHAEYMKDAATTPYQEALEEGSINTLTILKDVLERPSAYGAMIDSIDKKN